MIFNDFWNIANVDLISVYSYDVVNYINEFRGLSP